ncbi:DUF4279 domain-containing protein [Plebeiibacterium sediminum]|uniref:DUF4279 domain-containing protein n=1 Tax=Plebeiibacterium sediminum TaxID=2992112 RepID=A0AAE3M588_9BACT|nr:DUF4279 domain-containing protein [Plebeiobacterium sediminum]MCW3787379.1 DUF4279 domain-containing protein [Plebeiobacterium sediminum]
MNIKRLDKDDYKKLQGSDNDLEVNQNHVILRFIGFDFDPNEITERLQLKPLSIARKGEDYFVGKRKVKKTWEYNHWDYELKTKTNAFIGETITEFFENIIEPRLELIKEISRKSDITQLIIVQYYYTGCNPGFAFEKKQVKILADINAEIDMDIYCLSKE